MALCTCEKSVDNYLFIKAQINAIDKSKFIESEKKHRDLFFDETGKPSQDFYFWWVQQHAEEFRKAWPTSICRKCSKVFSCKDCLKETCPQFNEGSGWEELHG
jgi:hypothetical protein